MRYAIRRNALAAPIAASIAEEIHQAVVSASTGLFEALHIEEKFDIFLENFAEFEVEVAKSTAIHMIGEDTSYQTIQLDRNLFNRRLVNSLAAGRLYLDHLSHHATKLRSLGVALDVDALRSNQYDSNFGYRLMEALRNYVQHRGYPIHGVIYDRSWIGSGSKEKSRHSIIPYLVPAELAADGKFKAAILEELRATGSKIDVKPLLRKYIESVGAIHSSVRKALKDKVLNWEKIIDEVIDFYRAERPSDDSIVGLEAVSFDDFDKEFNKTPIFIEHREYRRHLERKNRTQVNMALRFATTEAIPIGTDGWPVR